LARILRGEVYWADLNPVRGREQAGSRPVLILSHDLFNRKSETVIVMAITSQAQRAGFPLTMALPGGMMPKLSWVKISQIRTISIDRLGKRIATLGPDGAVASSGKTAITVPAIPVTPVDTTGAGDTFCGVLAALLDERADLEAAMRYAAAAGSLACLREGAQPSFPTRTEIEAAVKSGRAP